jgi:hypothetical protein
MAHSQKLALTVGLFLTLASCAYAQQISSPGPERAEIAPAAGGETSVPAPGGADAVEGKPSSTLAADLGVLDRLLRTVSHDEDPDGPINTDRPTFTPANTVVPRGRLQFESGWTVNAEHTSQTRSTIYDLPELAARYGLTDRLEFRMFWSGETFNEERVRRRRPLRSLDGPGDTEVGFKWQLFPGDDKRKWIPTTALISSIIAPTGGSSVYSSETVEPYVNLIYGWNLTKQLTLCGSTGYLGIREQGVPNSIPRSYNLQRWHQSAVVFLTPAERATFFYEWYTLMFTNGADNRPASFMDGGLIYRLTPNIQVDIRAGFGLSGRPDDFFTGTGFSVRF